MKFLALALCLLLTSSYAVNIKLQPNVVKKHPKLVLAQIAAKLTEGGPLEDVFDMLQAMKGELAEE
jgi:hypothetical protein